MKAAKTLLYFTGCFCAGNVAISMREQDWLGAAYFAALAAFNFYMAQDRA